MASDLRPLHSHFEKQRIGVAVSSPFYDGHYVSAGIAFVPVFFTASAPEHHFATFVRAAERFFVHPSHHQHIAFVGVLNDCRCELHATELHFELYFFNQIFELHLSSLVCSHVVAFYPLICPLPRRIHL